MGKYKPYVLCTLFGVGGNFK